MPYVTINEIRLYYEVHGEGETILLLHHGFGCTMMWEQIWPKLVKNGYRIVMYDRRGYGRSGKGKNFKEFYVSNRFRFETVKELEELINFLKIDSFHIVGQCEGGVIGVDYTIKFPNKVQTLITSSTQCYSVIPMAEFNRKKFTKSFEELESDIKKKLIEWHGENYAEKFYEQFRRYGGAYGKDIFDLRPLLPKVTCPSLVLYPDRSFLFDVEQGVSFYRHLPKGELAVLPGCGHNTYEHRPDEYTEQILRFIARNRE